MDIVRTSAYDLDLSGFDLEMLILMAQFGSQLAEKELMERFYGLVKKQIDRLARRKRLRAEDLADTEQNAVFAMDEAIHKYQLHPPADETKCSFSSYLHTVVEARFHDYMKRLSRNAKHFDSTLEAKKALDAAASGTAPSWRKEKRATSLDPRDEDPARQAEDKEFWERWWRAVDQLSVNAHRIYEATIARKPLDLLAKELHVSWRTLHRAKKEMMAELKAKLKL